MNTDSETLSDLNPAISICGLGDSHNSRTLTLSAISRNELADTPAVRVESVELLVEGCKQSLIYSDVFRGWIVGDECVSEGQTICIIKWGVEADCIAADAVRADGAVSITCPESGFRANTTTTALHLLTGALDLRYDATIDFFSHRDQLRTVGIIRITDWVKEF